MNKPAEPVEIFSRLEALGFVRRDGKHCVTGEHYVFFECGAVPASYTWWPDHNQWQCITAKIPDFKPRLYLMTDSEMRMVIGWMERNWGGNKG